MVPAPLGLDFAQTLGRTAARAVGSSRSRGDRRAGDRYVPSTVDALQNHRSATSIRCIATSLADEARQAVDLATPGTGGLILVVGVPDPIRAQCRTSAR